MSLSTVWLRPGCNTRVTGRERILLPHVPDEARMLESLRSGLPPGEQDPEALRSRGVLETTMMAKAKDERESSPRGFYNCALNEAERVGLEEAFNVEGLDDEIALLRVKLRALLEAQPERTDLHFEAANVIARLVKTRYQITREEKKSLREAIQKVLSEIALPMGVGVGIKLAGK